MSRYYFDKQVFFTLIRWIQKKKRCIGSVLFSLAERTFYTSSDCDLIPDVLRDNVFSSNLH